MREERRMRDVRPDFGDRRARLGDPFPYEGRSRARDLEAEDYPGELGSWNDEEWPERRFRGRSSSEWDRRFAERGGMSGERERGNYGNYGERSGMSGERERGYGSFRPRGFERGGWGSPRSYAGTEWGSHGNYGELGDDFESRFRPEWGSNWGSQWGSWRERNPSQRSYGSFYGGSPRETRGGSSYGGYEPRSSWGMSQSFAGRGPKGYSRSDDRIREDVSDVLMEHPAIDAGGIEVQVLGGTVTLTGSTTDRRTKRLAEDVVESISGVKDVQNQIRVTSSGDDNGRDTSMQYQDAGRTISSTTYGEPTKGSKSR